MHVKTGADKQTIDRSVTVLDPLACWQQAGLQQQRGMLQEAQAAPAPRIPAS